MTDADFYLDSLGRRCYYDRPPAELSTSQADGLRALLTLIANEVTESNKPWRSYWKRVRR